MSEKELAQHIIRLVGGKENIASVQHCATRLRIVVHDKDKINVKEVENLDKVKGSFFNAGQYQIILGTGLVNRVYDEAMTQLNLAAESPVPEDTTSKPVYGNKFQRAIRMFSDVFVPIIPVLVATGLFMGLHGLLTQEAVLGVFGMTPDDIPNQLLLFTQILTDTAFAFLPALVCWSTFKNFGGSPVIGIVLALFVLGPILHTVENVVLYAVEGLLTLPFGIGGLLYGGSGQLLGIFGIHHILNFLEISMLANDGWNYLNPIGTCGNVAQAGAVLAVAIKALSAKTKQVAYPSCLSALLGITEPAVFGVNLRFVKPFIMAMIGGSGGFLASLLGLRATGMPITGIPGTLLYLNEQLPFYILVNVVAFAVAFVLTYFFGFHSKMENQA